MQERDVIPQRPTLLLVIASLVTIVASLLVVELLLRERVDTLPDRGTPANARHLPRELSGLEQTPAIDDGAQLDYDAQRRDLRSYGWVDRAHGVVHVPIEKAMRDAVAREQTLRTPGEGTP